jgi:hypothetical protein
MMNDLISVEKVLYNIINYFLCQLQGAPRNRILFAGVSSAALDGPMGFFILCPL